MAEQSAYDIFASRILMCGSCEQAVSEYEIAPLLECNSCGYEVAEGEAYSRRCPDCGRFMANSGRFVHDACGNEDFGWATWADDPVTVEQLLALIGTTKKATQ